MEELSLILTQTFVGIVKMALCFLFAFVLLVHANTRERD